MEIQAKSTRNFICEWYKALKLREKLISSYGGKIQKVQCKGRIQNIDHPCGPSQWTTSWTPGPWTTPVDHHSSFCKVTSRKIFRRKREIILSLIWQLSLINTWKIQVAPTGFETHDPLRCQCNALINWAMKLREGQFVPVKNSMNERNVY